MIEVLASPRKVREDWIMLKGTVMGPRKRLITMRTSDPMEVQGSGLWGFCFEA